MSKMLLETVSSFQDFTDRGRFAPAAADPRDDILNHIGPMRAYALALTLDRATADDLVEDTLVHALKTADAVGQQTDARLWLLTVLHDTYHAAPINIGRASSRAGDHMDAMAIKARLFQSVTPESFRLAFDSLPLNQREALALTGAERLSFRHAATVCGCSASVLRKYASDGRDGLAASLPFAHEGASQRSRQRSSRQPGTTVDLARFA